MDKNAELNTSRWRCPLIALALALIMSGGCSGGSGSSDAGGPAKWGQAKWGQAEWNE